MKKVLLSGVAALALVGATGAFAADLPSRKAPAPVFVPPAFTWTGFYVGVNAGFNWGDNGSTYIGNAGLLTALGTAGIPASFSGNSDGFTGGVQAGYNYQFGQIVVGVEADINYIDGKKSVSAINFGTFPTFGTAVVSANASSGIEYLGTVRARLGFAADRFLVYVTGGLAYGEVTNSGGIGVTGGPLNGAFWAGSKSDLRVGYALGGGAEYAFTNNVIFGVEAIYYDLGDNTATIGGTNALTTATNLFAIQRVETSGVMARARLNYKF